MLADPDDSLSTMSTGIAVRVTDTIATITLNRPASYNALMPEDYEDLGEALRTIDKREDVLVTVWQAHGNYFCAGTDIGVLEPGAKNPVTQRQFFLEKVTRTNTDICHALATHSKILVAALNGPVMGIAAAFLGHFDFIYALPTVWLAVPFTYLGLVSEGGASVTFVERMGSAMAKEALLFGKKLTAADLLQSRFINKLFPEQSVASFHAAVHEHLLEELRGLDPQALLKVKALLKAGSVERNSLEAVNIRESYAQADRFASRVPHSRFMQLAKREIRHKL